MADKLFNLFSDNPTLITHCPICNARFNPLEAKILQEGDTTHLVHVKCQYCHSAILALIVVNNLGVSSVGLVTDLHHDDVLKFSEGKAISIDDVLEVHQELNNQKVFIDYLK